MTNQHGNHHHEEHAHHVTPMMVYIKTFAALIFLTIVTVVTSYFHFGSWNLPIAMLIATTKAVLVMWFFMQLKYDETGNKVAFYSSFVFLAIFLGLVGADFFTREKINPMKVEKVAGGGITDPSKLNAATPELTKKGGELFAQQCASCHGAGGAGDGVAAAALNPKPRNFKSGVWKFGGSPSKIFKTLTQGSPGTAMGAFTTLSIEERYALAHYVRSISTPVPGEDTPSDLNEAKQLAGDGGGASQEIPIDFAMEQMSERDQVVLPQDVKNPSHPGAYLFQAQCAQCHGVSGMGARVATLGVNPPAILITKSFAESNGPWKQSEAAFIKTVSEGLPGSGMPGMAGYTATEWSALYSYVRSLQ